MSSSNYSLGIERFGWAIPWLAGEKDLCRVLKKMNNGELELEITVDELLTKATDALGRCEWDEAVSLCQEALTLEHNNAVALYLIGVSFMASVRPAEAIAVFERVLILDPSSYDTLAFLTKAHLMIGEVDKAVEYADKAVTVDDTRYEGFLNLAVAQIHAGRINDAISLLRWVLQVDPANSDAAYQLGVGLMVAEDYEEAATAIRFAIQLHPNIADYHISLGEVYIKLDRPAYALRSADAALELEPEQVKAIRLKGQALSFLQRTKESDYWLDIAHEMDSESASAHLTAGFRFQREGEFQNARKHFEAALELDDTFGHAYHSLAQLVDFATDPEPLFSMMKDALTRHGFPTSSLLLVHYALGKAYEDTSEFETSIRHFDEANRLSYKINRALRPWEPDKLFCRATESAATFTPEFMRLHGNAGVQSELPIFVVGMIRSGTTLVEQIISKHPDVAPAGEQMFWTATFGQSQYRNLESLVPTSSNELSHRYLDLLQGYGQGHSRVTDKYPGNYLFLGAIHVHLPKAKFIHVRRNPVDTCLSAWTTHIVKGPPFLNDRDDIVAVYREYQAYLRHWRTVLTAETLLEIDYEELVENQETVSKRMIAFCGLEWSDECLRPQDNTRSVFTPSLWRVRQPVDGRSVARWRKYEPWLGSFKDLLEPAQL